MRYFAWVKLFLGVLIWLATSVVAPVFAQSACTGLFGIIDNDGNVGTVPTSLGYFNSTTNQWIRLGPLAAGGATIQHNSLAANPVNGLLYYVNRTTRQLRSVNLNITSATAPFTETVLGIIPVPPVVVPGTTTLSSLLGGTFDSAGNFYVFANNQQGAATGSLGYLTQIQITSPTAFTVTVPWTTVTYPTGATPTLGNSGDIYCSSPTSCTLVSNTAPEPTLYALNLTPGITTFAKVATPSAVVTGANNFQIGGIAVDPASQVTYIGATTTLSLTGLAATVVNSTTITVDMGSCATQPAAPSLVKSITPPYSAASPGTATVVINLVNSNTNPVYLSSIFSDVLPPGMVVANPTGLTSTCSSSLGTPTTSVGGTSVTFAAGGRIPASPGCSITFNVSATASVNAYTNTIPAGSLTTVAGTNSAAVTATYKVGTDFSAAKSQCIGTCGTPTTSTISVAGNQTVQYVLTITNSSVGGTGSATFTDTLPTLMTPVLSITVGTTTGGVCTTASAVISGATRITGTFANAPAGAQCLITVTAIATAQATSTTVTNTLTLATTAGTVDTNLANNTASVLTNAGAAAFLTIAKSNGTNTVTAGSTINYTITVANLGPANASNSIIKDPVVSGLNCTAATCAVTAGTASCPAGVPSALMTALQGTGGAIISTFNANSTLSFVVTCGVTATGQ